MKDNKRTTKQVIAEQQAINRKLWAKENGRLHHVDANKLIAEFMGLYDEISLDSIAGNIHSWSDAPFFYITEDSKEKVMEGITKYSKYHTSWDWLIPVVQKIESLGYVFTIQGGKAEYGEMISETRCFIAEDKLSSTYQAVVEFIKEYNNESRNI